MKTPHQLTRIDGFGHTDVFRGPLGRFVSPSRGSLVRALGGPVGRYIGRSRGGVTHISWSPCMDCCRLKVRLVSRVLKGEA